MRPDAHAPASRRHGRRCGPNPSGPVHRLLYLLGSRRQDFAELLSTNSVEEVTAWSARHRLLGFNGSALRLRIIHALAEALDASHFVETGTYHGATSIAARRCLGIPVSTCEIRARARLVARFVTFGIRGIDVIAGDSRTFLERFVGAVRDRGDSRVLFYLDAHAGITPEACPLLDELEAVVGLDQFVAVVDDFAVSDRGYADPTYGKLHLNVELIRGVLTGAGIRRIFVPRYGADLEGAKVAYAVVIRSATVEQAVREGSFPLGLLEEVQLA